MAAATVRAVRAGEAERLREVRLRALSESPDAFAASAEEEAAMPAQEWARRAADAADGRDTVIFLALAGDHVVGMAGGRRFDAERGVAQLWGMWVDPVCRGLGVGVALVVAVRAWASADGARFLRLGVLAGPREPTGFYERLGFVRTGEQRPYPKDPSRTVFWMARPV